MKYIFLTVLLLSGSINVSYAVNHRFDCGTVKILEVITGPRHGAMMRVDNANCKATPAATTNGWVCLDPDAEHMSAAESERLFAEIMSMYLANRSILLSVYTGKTSIACNGPYPVLEDVRSR